MSNIKKHSFEAVSLLTAENGTLDISIIPSVGQPDWLIPTSLILSVDEYHERIWTYLWRNQEVSVYHLVPKEVAVDKLIVLEGNSDVHRLALQTAGELKSLKVRISDVKDVELEEDAKEEIKGSIPESPTLQSEHEDYLYQAVTVNGETYVVPDLDLIAHRLVDLDS